MVVASTPRSKRLRCKVRYTVASFVMPPNAGATWASSVVAVSRGAADDLARTSGFPRGQVEVVYNPVITRSVMALALKPSAKA